MSFLTRFSRTQLIIGGLLTYATGVSAALTFFPSTPPSGAGGASQEDDATRFPTESARRSTFDQLAPGYDKDVGFHEYLLGIQRRRKRLLKQARGRVLEIASGTGRNVDYYLKGCCDEIVFSDFSEGMMEVLKKKVAEKTEIRFKTMNAAAIPYPDQSFDTVVDTFGLCSFEDPVQVLKEMRRVLRPGGQLLLLEHGNSHWGFMQDMQARQLDRHVHKYGCYWNREIEELVQDAGLRVVEKERSQLGTVYYMIVE
ncbi:MAG: S-adenosyl-L-methionine-dependent methyltransferase [Benniella sp.]|nr:MAG: S-adenosyl-L-methionine-dependent methyltransferase [Benniella sp.]